MGCLALNLPPFGLNRCEAYFHMMASLQMGVPRAQSADFMRVSREPKHRQNAITQGKVITPLPWMSKQPYLLS